MKESEIVLGVDIGGTNTKFGFVDRRGKCLASGWIPTNARQPAETFFDRLQENARELLHGLQGAYELIGIGIGAPNGNYFKSTIELSHHLGWDHVDVRAQLDKYFHIPIAVTNDANAAALGEMLFGAARGMKDFIAITLGTGLGSGIVSNGALVYGSDGFAGEIGHTTVDPNGRQCKCGKRGCLETYCSATGLCRTVFELFCNTTTPSELRNLSCVSMTSEMVYQSALRGDPLALEAFDITGRILGIKLADSVAHLSPEAIILLGGLAAAGDLIFNPTGRALEENLFPVFRNKVRLLQSGLPEANAAVLGAGALIWNELARSS